MDQAVRMRIYLDTCTLQRPLDDREQLRIALEADAILAILALCEQGQLTLVASDVIRFETARNPHPQRQLFAQAILDRAQEHIALTDAMTRRATELERRGVKAIDALHWASAEAVNVDVFCTCDDRFYRKVLTLPDCTLPIRTPLALAQEVLL